MSNTQFCLEQRQREHRLQKKILVGGLVSSALLHSILAYTLPQWSPESKTKAEKPIELILVDKPKPKIEPKPIPKPKPKPIKTQTPPPPVKPPEPVKAQTPPPKPVPQKVLTTPSPTPTAPIVSAPIKNTPQITSINNSFTTQTNSVTATASNNHPGAVTGVVASNTAPPRPQTSQGELACISNCEPEYPDVLEGVEGTVGVRLTIEPSGNVAGVELATLSNDNRVNREALLAARQMQFTPPPGGNTTSVQVEINFTVEGTEYDRLAREEQERNEKAARERQERETARLQQLEAERKARQVQLRRERQVRQETERSGGNK